MKKFLFVACIFPFVGIAQKNIVKINGSSLVARTVSLQYERQISKKISLAVGYKFTPEGGLPFQSSINNIIDDPSVRFDQMQVKGSAITPEIRFYTGKNMKGFYLAPYARWGTTEASNLPVVVNYTVAGNAQSTTATFGGKSTGFGGGVMIGTQFTLLKFVNIDLWIIGAHIGSGSGEMNATFSSPLPIQGQQELSRQLEEVKNNASFLNMTYSVNANGAQVNIGRYAGIRGAGVTIGFRL
ncbi:MAG: DUF3575 domain-containing protein [Hydrotalea sp.]|nr:DUF3575 domain-containing protein [Hydrotalea sp.]